MATKIGILIVEDDEATQSALRQVLDAEGWHVRIVPVLRDALAELSSGEWSLVILNIAMTGLAGPVYLTLRELALAPAVEEGMVRARVLFLVPDAQAVEIQPALEKALPKLETAAQARLGQGIVIGVVSATPGSGFTPIATNLAFLWAESYKDRVVLVEFWTYG